MLLCPRVGPELLLLEWGRLDSNQRPTDYESVSGRFRDLRKSAKSGPELRKDVPVITRW